MSIARAFQADVPTPAHKLVLLAMTGLARKEGDRLLFSAAPSRVADLAQVDQGTLIRAFHDLIRRGLIADTDERAGRDKATKVFELLLPEASKE